MDITCGDATNDRRRQQEQLQTLHSQEHAFQGVDAVLILSGDATGVRRSVVLVIHV